MKQMLRKKDVWVLLAALIGAFACVTLIQFISGRIDGVASMVFLLAVFFVSMYTDGYWWGVAGSVISVLAVNRGEVIVREDVRNIALRAGDTFINPTVELTNLLTYVSCVCTRNV